MGIKNSGKLFLIIGLAISLLGYFFHIKEIGGIMGGLFMITGGIFDHCLFCGIYIKMA